MQVALGLDVSQLEASVGQAASIFRNLKSNINNISLNASIKGDPFSGQYQYLDKFVQEFDKVFKFVAKNSAEMYGTSDAKANKWVTSQTMAFHQVLAAMDKVQQAYSALKTSQDTFNLTPGVQSWNKAKYEAGLQQYLGDLPTKLKEANNKLLEEVVNYQSKLVMENEARYKEMARSILATYNLLKENIQKLNLTPEQKMQIGVELRKEDIARVNALKKQLVSGIESFNTLELESKSGKSTTTYKAIGNLENEKSIRQAIIGLAARGVTIDEQDLRTLAQISAQVQYIKDQFQILERVKSVALKYNDYETFKLASAEQRKILGLSVQTVAEFNQLTKAEQESFLASQKIGTSYSDLVGKIKIVKEQLEILGTARRENIFAKDTIAATQLEQKIKDLKQELFDLNREALARSGNTSAVAAMDAKINADRKAAMLSKDYGVKSYDELLVKQRELQQRLNDLKSPEASRGFDTLENGASKLQLALAEVDAELAKVTLSMAKIDPKQMNDPTKIAGLESSVAIKQSILDQASASKKVLDNQTKLNRSYEEQMIKLRNINVDVLKVSRAQMKDVFTQNEILKLYRQIEQAKASGVQLTNEQLKTEAALLPIVGKIKSIQQAQAGALGIIDVSRLKWFAQLRIFWAGYQLAAEALQNMVQFEQSITNVGNLANATTQQFDKLRQGAMQIALETNASTVEIADAMTTVAQAGFNANDILVITRNSAELATATLSDFRSATDLVTSTIKAWNMEASQSKEISDAFASAVNSTKLTMEGLNTSFNHVTGIAPEMNMSLQETLAALGQMADRGLAASIQGTSLRTVLSSMIEPNTRFLRSLNAVGLSANDINPKLHDFGSILVTLKEAGFDTASAFEGLDRRAAAGIAILVETANSYDGLVQKMHEMNVAQAMSSSNMKTILAQWKNFKDAMVKVVDDAVMPFNDVAQTTVSVLTGITLSLGRFIGKTAELIGAHLDTVFKVIFFSFSSSYAKQVNSIENEIVKINDKLKENQVELSNVTAELERVVEAYTNFREAQQLGQYSKNVAGTELATVNNMIAALETAKKQKLVSEEIINSRKKELNGIINIKNKGEDTTKSLSDLTKTLKVDIENVNTAYEGTIASLATIKEIREKIKENNVEQLLGKQIDLLNLKYGQLSQNADSLLRRFTTRPFANSLKDTFGIGKTSMENIEDLRKMYETFTSSIGSMSSKEADNLLLKSLGTPEAVEKYKNKMQEIALVLQNYDDQVKKYRKEQGDKSSLNPFKDTEQEQVNAYRSFADKALRAAKDKLDMSDVGRSMADQLAEKFANETAAALQRQDFKTARQKYYNYILNVYDPNLLSSAAQKATKKMNETLSTSTFKLDPEQRKKWLTYITNSASQAEDIVEGSSRTIRNSFNLASKNADAALDSLANESFAKISGAASDTGKVMNDLTVAFATMKGEANKPGGGVFWTDYRDKVSDVNSQINDLIEVQKNSTRAAKIYTSVIKGWQDISIDVSTTIDGKTVSQWFNDMMKDKRNIEKFITAVGKSYSSTVAAGTRELLKGFKGETVPKDKKKKEKDKTSYEELDLLKQQVLVLDEQIKRIEKFGKTTILSNTLLQEQYEIEKGVVRANEEKVIAANKARRQAEEDLNIAQKAFNLRFKENDDSEAAQEARHGLYEIELKVQKATQKELEARNSIAKSTEDMTKMLQQQIELEDQRTRLFAEQVNAFVFERNLEALELQRQLQLNELSLKRVKYHEDLKLDAEQQLAITRDQISLSNKRIEQLREEAKLAGKQQANELLKTTANSELIAGSPSNAKNKEVQAEAAAYKDIAANKEYIDALNRDDYDMAVQVLNTLQTKINDELALSNIQQDRKEFLEVESKLIQNQLEKVIKLKDNDKEVSSLLADIATKQEQINELTEKQLVNSNRIADITKAFNLGLEQGIANMQTLGSTSKDLGYYLGNLGNDFLNSFSEATQTFTSDVIGQKWFGETSAEVEHIKSQLDEIQDKKREALEHNSKGNYQQLLWYEDQLIAKKKQEETLTVQAAKAFQSFSQMFIKEVMAQITALMAKLAIQTAIAALSGGVSMIGDTFSALTGGLNVGPYATGGVLPDIKKSINFGDIKSFGGGGATSGLTMAFLGDNPSKKELIIPSEGIKKDKVTGYTRDTSQQQNVTVINVMSKADIATAMMSKEGESVILNAIGKDIDKKGAIYRLMQGSMK